MITVTKLTPLEQMEKAITEILYITHNQGIGLKAITGQEDGTNRVVFTPSQLNRIGELARQALGRV